MPADNHTESGAAAPLIPANEGEVERLRGAAVSIAHAVMNEEMDLFRKHEASFYRHGALVAEAIAERIAALSTPAQSGEEPDLSGLQGVEKLAHLMAWHHFGLRWDCMEKVSQAEVTAACQAAFDWMNRPLADRQAALSPDTSKVGAVDVVIQADREAAAAAGSSLGRYVAVENAQIRLGELDSDPLVKAFAAHRIATLRASPPPVEAGMVEAERRGERRAIARIANVARLIGWQAGVGGRETAGAIVSYLVTSPDEIVPFVAGELSPLDFAGDWMRGGCLTWQGADGKVWSPEEAAAAREAKSAAPKDMEEGR